MDDRQADRRRTILDRAAALENARAWDEAAALYEDLLDRDPNDPQLLCSLGTVELYRKRTEQSVTILERAATLRPNAPEIRNQLGMAYKTLRRWGDASRQFEHALRIDAGFAASYYHLGDMAHALGQWDSAVSLFRQAIGLAPNVAEPHVALGNLMFAHANWEGAVQCFASALQASEGPLDKSGRLEVQSRMGVALLRQDKLNEASAVFREMLSTAPNLAEIHSNLCFVCERQGQLSSAIEFGKQAVQLSPLLADGWNNLGVAYRSVHDLDRAADAFSKAIDRKPGFELAEFNLASVRLMRENYAQGWAGYEARRALLGGKPRRFLMPRWSGEPLPGQTLLLHAEQGFGDTLQFIRFASEARKRSQARIVVEVPAALQSLIARAEGIDECLACGSRLPEAAAELPLPSLPGVLEVGARQIAGGTSYLSAHPSRVQEWSRRLHDLAPVGKARRIGICWQGNAQQSQDRNRSCPFGRFARLQGIPGLQWFSLQKDTVDPFRDEAGLGIVPLGHLLNDFDDTAAVMACLDLVITVDTSVAHLAGALGRPVWTLLCHTPDWRWQLNRSDCPWYPGMRLFRQSEWGDWDGALEGVAAALRVWSSAHCGRPGS